MFITYKNTKIYYEMIGRNSKANFAVLFLHGWGASGSVMRPLGENLGDFLQIFVDFPPFGKSDEPKNTWDIFDYADAVFGVLKAEKITKVKIIAHSFGGRVAILLSKKYNIVESFVTLGGAGLKLVKPLKVRIKILNFKLRKLLKINTGNYGSADYQNLSENMRKTFVKIVNFDVKNFCKNNLTNALLIYGKNDRETPAKMGKKFHKYLKNSRLVLLENAGHYVWLDKKFEVQNLLENFIKN